MLCVCVCVCVCVLSCGVMQVHEIITIFAQIDAAATIYFMMRVGVAFIQGQHLFLSARNVGVATPSIVCMQHSS